jgi:CcmD family protein
MAENNWMFITAAYSITWIVILGYLLRVHSALRRARAEYATVAGSPAGRPS